MGIFSRLTDIVQANLNALLDRAEEPDKLIRLIIQEMEDTLVEVRSSTVRIIADRKEIQRRLDELARLRDDWERKAELALTHGREDLARGALAEKARLTGQIVTEKEQLALVDGDLAKANDDIGRLQAKLDDAKSREAALAVRHKSASARVKLRAVLHDPRVEGAFARFEQVERNLDELEGRAESHDMGRDGAAAATGKRGDTLADQIAALETEAAVADDLARLKARLAARNGG